jgi:hypothetical protein
MSRKLFFRILFLATLISILVALPALAASSPRDALRPAVQTTPEPAAVEAQPVFRAVLSGAAVNPPVATNASGEAVFVLADQAGTLTLYYKVMVSEIEGITAAYIREGEPGEDGPVVFTLFDGMGTFDPENPISGSTALSNAQVTELLAGNYYVEVETSANPGGEIRGQILPYTPPNRFRAPLTGEAEVQPVETEASGLATFRLNASLDTLQYTVAVRSITGITHAHVYTGQPGEAGTILWTLYDGTGPFDPDNPISGNQPVAPDELLELLTGNLFVNVLTTAHPSGEIRGQIGSGPLAFEAILSGENEVPRVATNASGRAVMVLKEDLATLLFHVSVAGIENVTAAHIHDGLPGENGPVLFNLFTGTGTFDPANPVSGSLTLTEEEVIELVAGNYYVNVHTEVNPGGEIRGQLGMMASVNVNALLTGSEEVPPVPTDAAGAARFTLDDEMNTLHYEIAVVNIEGITAAHLHPGFRGEEGPPEITIYSPTDPRDFDPDNPLSGEASLTAEQLLDLLIGRYYLNIHTSAYPEGEIRGQVESRFHAFQALLTGADAVPPASTGASGRGIFVLDDDLVTLYYRVLVSDIEDISASHIRYAPDGGSGSVEFTLFDGNGDFGPEDPISDSLALTLAQAARLAAGDYYLNVETDEFPEGEIRGQLRAHSLPPGFAATLTGEAQTPPVTTTATGEARFSLNHEMNRLHYFLSVQDIENITGAHVHRGAPGEPGPAVFALFEGAGDFGPDDPISGVLVLGPQDLLDLLSGFLYANVTTEQHTEGEIRGQINPQRVLYLPLVFKNLVTE